MLAMLTAMLTAMLIAMTIAQHRGTLLGDLQHGHIRAAVDDRPVLVTPGKKRGYSALDASPSGIEEAVRHPGLKLNIPP